MKLKSRFIAGMLAAILGITTLQIPLPYVYAEEQNPEVIISDTVENYEWTSEREEDSLIEDTESSDTANLEIGLEETESISENTNKDADMSQKETDEMTESKEGEEQTEIGDPTEVDQEMPGLLEGLDESMNSDNAVKAAGANIASGTYKNEQDGSDISWVIDADGKLTVEGTGNFSDLTEEDRAPWSNHRMDIKSAKVNVRGMTDASYMFYQCNAMTSVDLSDFDTHQVKNMNRMFFNCLNLTVLDVSNFNTSQVENMSGMFAGCRKLSVLDVSRLDTSKVTNMAQMFRACENITYLDVSKFDTSNVTEIGGMFLDCKKLLSLDVSRFDTSKVIYMSTMFAGCQSLSELDVSNFNTENVTYMMKTFGGCSQLQRLDVSNFNTGNVTSMSAMFAGCQGLASITVGNFNTSKVTDMSYMFDGCSNLKGLNLSNYNTNSVTDISRIFRNCSSLTYLDINNWNFDKVTSYASDILELIYSCTSLTNICVPANLSKDIKLPVKTGDKWYDSEGNVYTRLPMNLDHSIILSRNKIPATSSSYITLQKVKTVYECGETLDLDDLTVTYYDETGKSMVINDYITNIDQIDMSTSGKKILTVTYNNGNVILTEELELTVTDKAIGGEIASGSYEKINWRIDSNGKLTVNGEHEFASIIISDYYDTIHFIRAPWYEYRDKIISAEINVKYMYDASYMFYGCTNLVSVDLSHFDTSRAGSMYGMFMKCKNLKTLDLSNLDTAQVRHMGSMFSGCNCLTDLKLGNFDTGQVTDMNSMFDSCSSLTKLDLSSFDVSNVSTMDSMFWECSALIDLNLSNFNTSNQLMYIADMFSGCRSLTELDLSSFDGSGVRDFQSFYGDDNTFSMFEDCSSLTTIYTPYNLVRYYQLPVDLGNVWYQPDGSSITKLPTGCESMMITKNRVPVISEAYIIATMRKTDYVCGDFIATSGLTVKYYGSDGTVKKVTEYTTNEDEIDMSTPGKKRLVITYNGLTAELELNVSVPQVESITLDKDSLTLSKGEIVTLHAEIFPQSALSLPVTWVSSDPSIAKVTEGPIHDGYVMAVSGGECTITVSAGDKSAICRVTVASDQADDDIAGGSYENVRWRIDVSGKLIVEGNGDFSGSNSTNRAPWFEKRAFIKSAEISLTGTTNASYMFYDCQNITVIDLSRFDTANVTDMTGIFCGCSSLTSLNLSSCGMAKVSNFADFFKGCQELSTIYAPRNLKVSVELPKGDSADSDDIWYDADGNTYTELPQNLERSMVLTRNQKPVISEPHITLEKGKTSYITGEKLTTDDLKVTYYNENGIPSIVIDYTTNADEIDMSMPGIKLLVVTYQELRAEIEITVRDKQSEETKGFKIAFKNEQDKESTYTGSAIKPEISVSYNGRHLVEGTNYTVRYANNVKVGNAKITVTGKGNFQSGKSENFKIVPADIADADIAGTDRAGRLVVVSGSKFAPIIYCGGRKLTAKDYSIDGTLTPGKKVTDSDSDKVITLNGKGSYKGKKTITLRVVRKSELIKFTVTLDKTKFDALTYDGKAHFVHDIHGAVTVAGKDGNTNMKYGTDYMIAYPANVTDAGVKKFSVIGMGLYTGTISKSYTIKPAINANGTLKVKYEPGNLENIKLPYRSTGVTFNDRLKVTYTKNGNTLTLREGRDYKVTYSGNKKVGSNAKFTIYFLGNYKGIPKQTRTFTIEKADLKDAAVVIADAVYKKNPGIYKSVPYVIESETGRLLKTSDYNVTYYIDSTRNIEMKGKNKVSSGDTVYVKIEAKANGNFKSDKPIIKTYQVINAINLSKAKITFKSAETGAITKSAEYTGQKITEREIKVLVDGKPADEDMIVTYANNIDKGKATVIVTGTGKLGCRYTGCKKATFNITAYRFR